jgi:hypothetical protein
MDLSALNILQQRTLFTLLILGHAISILGIVSLIRLWALRSAFKMNSNNEKAEQTVPRTPTLEMLEKEITEDKEGISSAKAPGKVKMTTAVREVPADASSPGEPEKSWNDYGFIVVTEQTPRNQSQRVTSITITGDKTTSRISCMTTRLKAMMQRAANRLTYRDSINYDEPGWVEYRAVSLISVLVILYLIGFLLLGILTIGLWSKFVRPDIPREDGVSPFWAGAFLATSAFCNNGMSLIDTNMGPYQKEYVVCSVQKNMKSFVNPI